MKTIKNNLYILAVAALLFLSFAFSASGANWLSGECGENVKYIYNCDSAELTISGKGAMYDYTASKSPFFNMKVEKVYIENGVTEIGSFSFENCTKLKNVYIPQSVKKISGRAFINCDKLDGVLLPDSLKEIDDYAFYGCESLKSIILPESLESVGSYCFSECISLEQAVISGGIIEISEGTFNNCYALSEVIVSGDVEYILDEAFRFCFSLKEVYLPQSLKEIAYGAFQQCYCLERVHFQGNEESWHSLNIDENKNEYLSDADITYNEHIHKYSMESYLKPTCTFEGEKNYLCSCGDKIIKEAQKTAHDYEGSIKKATLNSSGKVQIKCNMCAREIESRTVYYPKTIKLKEDSFVYSGKKIVPEVSVKDSKSNTLTEGVDYSVSYDGTIKKPGKYKVTVSFIGDYSGSKVLTLIVSPKKVSVKMKSQTTDSITLSYGESVGATGYRIYKYNAQSKKYETVKTTSKLSYKVTKLKDGSVYKFKVRPYFKSEDGTVIWGSNSSVLTVATKPSTPKINAVSLKNKKATLTWSDVTGESGYQIYYSTDKNGTYKKMASVKENTLTYTSSALTSGKTYYFKLRAYKKVEDTTVYSAFSGVKSVKVPTVYYVTKSGTKYHVDGCASLNKSKTAISYKDAVAKGYKPCKVCIK